MVSKNTKNILKKNNSTIFSCNGLKIQQLKIIIYICIQNKKLYDFYTTKINALWTKIKMQKDILMKN